MVPGIVAVVIPGDEAKAARVSDGGDNWRQHTGVKVDFIPPQCTDLIAAAASEGQQFNDITEVIVGAGIKYRFQLAVTEQRSRGITPASGLLVATTGLDSHNPSPMAQTYKAERV